MDAGDREWPTATEFDRLRAPPLIAYVDGNETNDAELVGVARGNVERYVALVERTQYEFRPALASDWRHAAAPTPSSHVAPRLLLWFRRPRPRRHAQCADTDDAEPIDVDVDAFAEDDIEERIPWRDGDELRLFERDSRDLVAFARVVGDPEQGEATGRLYVDVERWASSRRRSMLARFVVE